MSGAHRSAVVLDIDGTLTHGGLPIDGAEEALVMLEKNHVPYVYMTNGAEVGPKEKAEMLSNALRRTVDVERVVMPHSPMKSLAADLRDKLVLTIGQLPGAKNMMEELGFKNVQSAPEYLSRFPQLHSEVTKAACGMDDCDRREWQDCDSPERVHGIFCMELPQDFAVSLQVAVDILISHDGTPGTPFSGKQGCPLFAGNPDIVYPSKWKVPRLTNGAFIECLRTMFAHLTNDEGSLDVTYCGKPYAPIYEETRLALLKQVDVVFPTCVFCIGDNLKSGAIAMGPPFVPILVKTGIFNSSMDAKGTRVFENVLEAVEWITSLREHDN